MTTNTSALPDLESSQKYHVHPSLSQFAIPISSLQSKYAEYARLVVGVAIVHPLTKKLLILQRASTETTLPNMYELPGGGAESCDGTILDTVARETREETGLVVSVVDNVVTFLSDMSMQEVCLAILPRS